MEIEERKTVLEKALINSFVEEYKAYKNTVEFINTDLRESNIDYQYNYDDFCVEFLNQTLKNLNEIDIFSFNEYNEFYINFWKFNLYNLECMLNHKLEDLGYNYDDFYKGSKIKQKTEDEDKTNK